MKPHLPIAASLIAVLMASTAVLAQQDKPQDKAQQPSMEHKGASEGAGKGRGAPAQQHDGGRRDGGGASKGAAAESGNGNGNAGSKAAESNRQAGPAEKTESKSRQAETPGANEPKGREQGPGAAKTAEPKSGQEPGAPKTNRADGKANGKANGKAAGTDDGKRQAGDQKGQGKADPKSAGQEPAPGKTRTGESKTGESKSGDTKTGQTNSKSGQGTFGYRPDESKTGQPGQTPPDRNADQRGADQKGVDQKAVANDRAAKVQVTTEQRTRIRQAIDIRRVEKVRRVDFTINIGTRVPTHVRFRRIPQAVVAVVPEYRGYDYFVVEERICVVQPRTRVIVAVIDESDGSVSRPQVSVLELTPDERSLILSSIDRQQARAKLDVRLSRGADVPASVELHDFPVTVVERAPKLRRYRFVVIGEEVMVVDPDTRAVSVVVDR